MRRRGGPRPVVLVVDDDARVLDGLTLLLAGGYDVVTTADPMAALAMVTSRRIDLIILDLLIHDSIDGITFLERLRPTGARVPVLVVSALNTAWTAAAALRLGALDYITKPIDEEAFLAAVASALHLEGARVVSPDASTQYPHLVLVDCDVALSAMLGVVLAGDVAVDAAEPAANLLDHVSTMRPALVVVDAAHCRVPVATLLPELASRVAPGRVLVIHGPSAVRRLAGAPRNVAMLPPPHTAARVLAGIVAELRDHAHAAPRFSPRVLAIIDYVTAHFTSGHIREVGRSLGQSPYYLSRLFRVETGMTLKAFVNHVRVEAARLLLRDTDDKIDAVAARVGVHDASHLSRLFVKYSGRRPGAVRKTARPA
jgi:DNA-binding response OmpR family regulator